MDALRRRRPFSPILVPLLAAVIAGACSSGGAAPTAGGAGASLALPGATAAGGGNAGGGNGGSGTIPCDKLAPLVTQITNVTISSTDPQPDNCTFTVNAPGDSSGGGLGGIISIRRESTEPGLFDTVVGVLTGKDGVDVSGVGDKARMNKDGSLFYALHNGHVWAVQQALLFSNADRTDVAKKLMLALFQFV